MSAITDVVVTFGGVLAGRTYRRIPESLNVDSGKSPAFLWTTKGSGAEPIVDLAVLYDDEPLPEGEGWVRLAQDVTKGAVEGQATYLALRRKQPSDDKLGIKEIAVLYEDAAVPDGFRLLDRVLNRGGPRTIRIAVRDLKEGDAPDFFGETLERGDRVDVYRAKEDGWFKGTVTAAEPRRVLVHLIGWPSSAEAWYPRRSEHLKEYNTETRGKDTRLEVRQGGVMSVNAETLEAMRETAFDVIAGRLSDEAAEAFLAEEMPAFLEQILSSEVDVKFHARVSRVCHAAAALVGEQMARRQALRPEMVQQLSRLCLGDARCNYFFKHKTQGMKEDDAGAEHYAGPGASLPKAGASRYFVSVVNALYAANVFEAAIRRLDMDPSDGGADSEPFSISIEEMHAYRLSLAESPHTTFSDEFVKRTWPRLCVAFHNRLLRITDKELRAHERSWLETHISKALIFINKWIIEGGHPDPWPSVGPHSLQQLDEEFRVLFSIRELRAPPLKIRIEGAQTLLKLIDGVRLAEGRTVKAPEPEPMTYGGGMVYGYGGGRRRKANKGPTKSLRFKGPELADLICKHRVVQAMCGLAVEGYYADLIKKRASNEATLGTELEELKVLSFDGARGLGLEEEEEGEGSGGGSASGGGGDGEDGASGEVKATRSASEPAEARFTPQDTAEMAPVDFTPPPLGPEAGKRQTRVDAHSEVLKRVTPVLVFLVEEGKLSDEHLDALWQAARSSDRSLRGAALKVIADLSEMLPRSRLFQIWKPFAALAPAELDATLIDLIEQVTRAALGRVDEGGEEGGDEGEGEGEMFGIPLLRACLGDAANITEGQRDRALSALLRLLCESPMGSPLEQQLRPIVKAAVESVRSGVDVAGSLSLVGDVARAAADSAAGKVTRSDSGGGGGGAAGEILGMGGGGERSMFDPYYQAPVGNDGGDEESGDAEAAKKAREEAAAAKAEEEKKAREARKEWGQGIVDWLMGPDLDVLGAVIDELAAYHASARTALVKRGFVPACEVSDEASSEEDGGEDGDGDGDGAAGDDAEEGAGKDSSGSGGKIASASFCPDLSVERTHLEEVRARLASLRLLLTSSTAATISDGALDRLWKILAQNYLIQSERGEFFEFLRQGQFEAGAPGGAAAAVDSDEEDGGSATPKEGEEEEEDEGVLLSSERAEALFRTKMCSASEMGFSALGPNDFQCWRAFFLSVNLKRKALEKHSHATMPFTTTSIDLVGIDALWEMVLTTKSTKVRDDARRLLLGVFTRLTASFKAHARGKARKQRILKRKKEKAAEKAKKEKADATAATLGVGGTDPSDPLLSDSKQGDDEEVGEDGEGKEGEGTNGEGGEEEEEEEEDEEGPEVALEREEDGVSKKDAWLAFLRVTCDKCDSLSKECEAAPEADDPRRRLSELVTVLRDFVWRVEETDQVCHSSANIMIRAYIHDPQDPRRSRGRVTRQLFFEMNKADRIHELRTYVSRRLGHPPTLCRMENWRHLYYDSQNNEFAEVEDFWCYKGIHVIPLNDPDYTTGSHNYKPDRYTFPTVAEDDEDAIARAHPLLALVNDDANLQTFYRVMNLPSSKADGGIDVSTRMFEILQMLPMARNVRESVRWLGGTASKDDFDGARPLVSGDYFEDDNEDMLRERFGMPTGPIDPVGSGGDGPDWTAIFPKDDPARLLYALETTRRIALRLIRAPEADLDPSTSLYAREERTREAWCKLFVSAGGLSHLYSLILNADLDVFMASRVGRRALAELLNLVRHFFQGEEATRLLHAGIDVQDEAETAALATGQRPATLTLSPAAAEVGYDPSSLVPKLVELVNAAARAADDEYARLAAIDAATKRAAEREAELAAGEPSGGDVMQASKNATKKKKDPEQVNVYDPLEKDIPTTEAAVARHAINTLVTLLAESHVALQALYDADNVERVLLAALVSNADRTIRSNLLRGLTRVARAVRAEDLPGGVVHPRDWLLQHLAPRLTDVYRGQNPDRCLEFFALLGSLFRADMVEPPRELRPVDEKKKPTRKGQIDPHAEEEEKKAEEEGSGDGGEGEKKTSGTHHLKPRFKPLPKSPGGDDALLLPKGVGDAPSKGVPIDAVALVKQMCALIRTHPVVEVGEDDADLILRGMLRALRQVLTRCPDLKPMMGTPDVEEDGRSFLEVVFTDVLFFQPPHDAPAEDVLPPKAKSVRTRQAALGFLLEVSHRCSENATALCSLIHAHHRENPAAKASTDGGSGGRRGMSSLLYGGYGYESSRDRSSTGYVGLHNLGCICYLNASMQQLFMIQDLRRSIFEIPPPTEDEREDSLLWQLQLMFANLQESQQQAYNPAGYTRAFKDWDGNPINTSEQRDASEYLTELFQKIEAGTQGTPQEDMLRRTLGGTVANELIAGDGMQYRANIEDFYFMSVPVKGHQSLQEGLKAAATGDVIEGYSGWEDADGNGLPPMDTTKRTSIKSAAPHLILHLRRFDFDFDVGMQVKLNDFFSFPRKLDLWPYTVEGRPDAVVAGEGGGGEGSAGTGARRIRSPEEAEEAADLGVGHTGNPYADTDMEREDWHYELVGMVIHSGTAQAGHYYSYIQERDDTGPTNRWFEFNDAWVSDWDPSNLEDGAFGGERVYETSGHWETHRKGGMYVQTWVPGRKVRSKRYANALLLFYDRVRPDSSSSSSSSSSKSGAPDKLERRASSDAAELEAESALASAEERDDVAASYAAKVRLEQARSRAAQRVLRAPVPSVLQNGIAANNDQHWRKRYILTDPYFDFMEQLLVVALDDTPVPVDGVDGAADAAAWASKTKDAMADEATDAAAARRSVYSGDPEGGDGASGAGAKEDGKEEAAISASEIKDEEDAKDQGGPKFALLRLGLDFVNNTIAARRDGALQSEQWRAKLRPLLRESPIAASWVVGRTSRSVAEVLPTITPRTLSHPERRSAVVDTALSLIRGGEQDFSSEATLEICRRAYSGADASDEDLLAPGAATVARFVACLAGALPRLLVNPECALSALDSLAALIDGTSESGEVANLLLELGALAMLVDWVTDGMSMHPELVVGPGGYRPPSSSTPATGSGGGEDGDDGDGKEGEADGEKDDRRHRPVLHDPRYQGAAMAVCARLLRASKPPSGSDTSPFSLPPKRPLSDMDREQVTFPVFISQLVSLRNMATAETVPILQSALVHLLWENEDLVDTVARGIQDAIGDASFRSVRPALLAVVPLLDVDDSLRESRIDSILSAAVRGLESNAAYFKECEEGLRAFLFLARKLAPIWKWCRSDKAQEMLAWARDWLANNDTPPEPDPGADSMGSGVMYMNMGGSGFRSPPSEEAGELPPIDAKVDEEGKAPYLSKDGGRSVTWHERTKTSNALLRPAFDLWLQRSGDLSVAISPSLEALGPKEAAVGKRVRVHYERTRGIWRRATIKEWLPERSCYRVEWDGNPTPPVDPIVDPEFSEIHVLEDDAPVVRDFDDPVIEEFPGDAGGVAPADHSAGQPTEV